MNVTETLSEGLKREYKVVIPAQDLHEHPLRREAPVVGRGRLLVDPTPLRVALDARLAGEPTIKPRTADASPLDGAMLLGRQADPGRYAPLVHVWRTAGS